MMTSVAVFLLILSVSLAMDCHGPADIVVAVPGSKIVSDSEFEYIENFLLNLTRYYDLSQTQIGLVLYGNDTEIISDLKSNLNAFETNTRITILSQRHLYDDVISGDLDIAAAIKTVHELLTLEGREVATKIGVIMTYGGMAHVTSDDTDEQTEDEILSAADTALGDGVALYAVAVNGSIPLLNNVTHDTCRLFSLGSNADLNTVVPYIANSMCHLITGSVIPLQSNNCFTELQEPPQVKAYSSCPRRGIEFLPDPTNCAYWYYCIEGTAVRQPCPVGTLFDTSISRCNVKDQVPCFSRIRCPKPDGMFQHPSDCSKFLNCFQNVPRVMACPEGTLFNMDMGYCDFENNVVCPEV